MEIPSHDALGNELARRLRGVNRMTRDDIIQAMGNPPNPDRVPQRIWDQLERETEEEAASILFLIFLASANFHAFGKEAGPNSRQGQIAGSQVDNLEGLGRTFSAARAASVAQSVRRSAQARFATLRRRYQDRPQAPRRMQITVDAEVVVGEAAARSVAQTETTVAQSAGGEAGIDLAGGKSLEDLWITEADNRVCPVCSPLHRTKRATWKDTRPDGPPAHPRCRCFILYENRQVVGESKLRSWKRRFSRFLRKRSQT